MPHFTIRRLLAQCIMPRISANDYYDAERGESVRKSLHALIQSEGIGGVCVFAGDALETAQMLKELQQIAARAQTLNMEWQCGFPAALPSHTLWRLVSPIIPQ
jgi:hypothetical protein